MLRNILHNSLSTITNALLLVLLILAGRYLGSEGFGKVSFALAVAFIFEPIMDPGFYQITIREIARQRELAKKYLANILGYKAVAAVIIFLILFCLINLMHLSRESMYAVFIMAFAGILKSFKNSFSSIFHAYEYFGIDAIIWFLERFFLLSVGMFVLYRGGGVVGLCLVFAGVRLFDLFFVVILTRLKVCKFTISFDFLFLKELLLTALPVGIFLIILNLYNYIDTVMLSMMCSDGEVGLYNAAFRIYEGLAVFPMVICTVFRPRISSSYHRDKAYFNELFIRGLKYVIIIGLSISVTGYLASDIAIKMLFGEEYVRSITALKILLCGSGFFFVLTYFQMMLVVMDRQKMILYVAIAGLVFNVVVNLILIPKHGFIGASIATIAGEILVFLALLGHLVKRDVKIQFFKTFTKPVLSLLATLVIMKFIPILLHISLEVIMINLMFLFFLWLFRVFDHKELAFITNKNTLFVGNK